MSWNLNNTIPELGRCVNVKTECSDFQLIFNRIHFKDKISNVQTDELPIRYPQIFWVNISDCSLKSWTSCPPRGKEEKEPADCYQHTVQSRHQWWNGGVLWPMTSWVTRICEGTISAERWMQVLEQQAASFSGTSVLISARRCRATFCTLQQRGF